MDTPVPSVQPSLSAPPQNAAREASKSPLSPATSHPPGFSHDRFESSDNDDDNDDDDDDADGDDDSISWRVRNTAEGGSQDEVENKSRLAPLHVTSADQGRRASGTASASRSNKDYVQPSDASPCFPPSRPRLHPFFLDLPHPAPPPLSTDARPVGTTAGVRAPSAFSDAAGQAVTDVHGAPASTPSGSRPAGQENISEVNEGPLTALQTDAAHAEVPADDQCSPSGSPLTASADLASGTASGAQAALTLPDSLSVDDIQARIRAISRDPNLTESEKNYQRQAILGHQYQKRQLREARAFLERMDLQRNKVSYSSFTDSTTGEKMLGCEHYPRACKIKAECCGLWVVCRLCHDESGIDHAMNRFDTKEVMCMRCGTIQPVARSCVNAECNILFAKYFCEKCKFYDNTPNKDIYHCDKCKICRVGKGIGHDNFHCDRCDACVSRDSSKSHRCLKKSLDANCPICGLYLFTSTKPVVFMRCGHTMHSHCFDIYTAEHYICPLCHKALTDMRPYYARIDDAVKRETMPAEHRDKVAEILCHDCDKRSVTSFHFLYLKCMVSNCGSYNTRLLRTFKGGSEDVGGPSSAGPSAGGGDEARDGEENVDAEDDIGTSGSSMEED